MKDQRLERRKANLINWTAWSHTKKTMSVSDALAWLHEHGYKHDGNWEIIDLKTGKVIGKRAKYVKVACKTEYLLEIYY